MQSIAEMSLPFLPVDEPEFHRDPMPFVEAARLQHPWLARFNEGYVVHGYQALKDLLVLDDKLEMGLGGVVEFYQLQGTPWARFMTEMLQSRTGSDHQRLRSSVANAFTPHQANQVRPLMRQVIAELLDAWVPRGELDFADFAAYFPITVLCGVLGVSTDFIGNLRSSIEKHMASLTLDRALIPSFTQAYDLLWNFVDELVLTRESSGDLHSEKLLDAMITAKINGDLDEDELRHLLLVLLIGGYDTSKNMLTLTVYTLLDYPEYWARCADDLEFCNKVIDEMLRFASIATIFRHVKEAFEYQGHHFPAGSFIALATPLANRDPSAFENPMLFNPERENRVNRHVAFGRGSHICLGQFLARAQLQEGLHLIAQRIKNPALSSSVSWRPFLGAWGLETLPIRFDVSS